MFSMFMSLSDVIVFWYIPVIVNDSADCHSSVKSSHKDPSGDES